LPLLPRKPIESLLLFRRLGLHSRLDGKGLDCALMLVSLQDGWSHCNLSFLVFRFEIKQAPLAGLQFGD
jgi:hypothetical protein